MFSLQETPTRRKSWIFLSSGVRSSVTQCRGGYPCKFCVQFNRRNCVPSSDIGVGREGTRDVRFSTISRATGLPQLMRLGEQNFIHFSPGNMEL